MRHFDKDSWEPQGVTSLEPNAWTALKKTDRNTLVTAGAGAGKTEFLAQKATYLLQTGICCVPKRILAISFKKDAAKNLTVRVSKRCPQEQARRFDSMTFDAFSKGLLDRFHPALPEQFYISSTYQIVFPTQNDFNDFLKRHDYNYVSAKQLENAIRQTDIPISRHNCTGIQQALILYWQEQLANRDKPLLSFAMINRLVKLIIERNLYIRRALQQTYQFVFIDEFQDTTKAQYDLLCTIFNNSNTVFTAVGDDKQRIMGWAGAMNDAFERFENEFNADRISLLSNWRSHEGLVRIQHAIARKIDNTVEEVQARGYCEIEGTISAIWQFRTRDEESTCLAQWINREVQSLDIKQHDIAILIRMNADQVARELTEFFTPYDLKIRNVARYLGEIQIQDLLEEELTSLFLPILRLGTKNRSPDDWTLTQQNYLFIEAVNPNDTLFQQHLLVKLERFVQQIRQKMKLCKPEPRVSKTIIEMLLDFFGHKSLQRAFPAYHNDRDFQRVYSGFVTLLQECTEYNNNWNDVLNEFEGINQVSLMTVHKSKGLEFHTMIFYGLDNRTWWSLDQQKAEELNAFFVAFTRARQRAFFSQCFARGGAISWIEQLLTPVNVQIIDGRTILN